MALRVNPSGREVYALYYRTATGLKRKLTLGLHGSITAKQARCLAKERLAEVTRGGDPSGERRRARQAPNMAKLVERDRVERLAQKKASTRTSRRPAKLPKRLEALVEPLTSDNPESPLRWTSKSTHALAAELAAHHPPVSHKKVVQLLRQMDCSLHRAAAASPD
jgi:hypothetical protein